MRTKDINSVHFHLFSDTGQIIKLGRVEYLVTSINGSSITAVTESKSKFWTNNKKIVVNDLPLP